jgi:ferrochelatase
MKKGLLLLNLGTPQSPEPPEVGAYLKEFLMDPLVIDVPWAARWFLVNVLIVPKRKFASSVQYKTSWTDRGSPLLFHLKDLAAKVAPLVAGEFELEYAMRYGSPSVATALAALRAKGVTDVTVLPLYPQYAESSTLSSIEACVQEAAKLSLRLSFVPAFYVDPAFIGPYAALVKKAWDAEKPEHLLMSFHSLPERHIRRTDRSGGKHCLRSPNCCDKIVAANRDCYRAQSYATARAIAQACNIPTSQYTVSFQSRLGRSEWIKPATEATIAELGQRGIKKLAVVCPSFVSDCLETIEEIGVRGAEVFEHAGGKEIVRIPCLNADESWARGVAELARNHGQQKLAEVAPPA